MAMRASFACFHPRFAYLAHRGYLSSFSHAESGYPADFMKFGRILDLPHGAFGLEYDNTLGKKYTMRLEALTYERALGEAKSFLGINADGQDGDGQSWELE
jgi:hypothetical protein